MRLEKRRLDGFMQTNANRSPLGITMDMKAGDEDEVFYLSKYNEEADYKQKVESLRSDEEYISLGRQLEEVRTSFESTKLLPMKPEQPTRH